MNTQEIEEIFSIALKREMEANAFYSRVAKKVKDSDVKKIFSQLAEDELGHFELLEKYKSDPTLPMKIDAPASDFKLAEHTELPPFSDDMKPKEAIALAMKKEQQAVEFYTKLAKNSSDQSIKDIFNNLANMELGHKQKLENAFIDIGYPEAF
ncbi:MAG: ferritin family protein [Candidatus Nanoarchaeia archaeon]